MRLHMRFFVFGFLMMDGFAFASTAAQLQQLQAEVAQLQTEFNPSNMIALDNTESFSALLANADTPYAVLQNQGQYKAMLTLGGMLEVDAQTWGGSHLTGVIPVHGYADNGSALAVTSANLYALANLNSWTQAYFEVEGGLTGYPTIIPEAFVNFGNLSKTPFYVSLGMADLPFGTFPGDGLVTDTLDDNAFAPTQVSQLDLGFSRGGFNTALALFNGQSDINDFVYSLAYSFAVQKFSVALGAGYMNDLRYTGSGIAAAYGTSSGRTNARSTLLSGGQNGAVDVNADVTYNVNATQSLEVAGEWDSTTNSPVSLGVATGKMQAWTLSGSYTLPVLHKNTTFAVDYSATVNMKRVPLQLPGQIDQASVSVLGVQSQWIGDVQTEALRNVYVGPEFAWMKLYRNDEHAWATTLDVSAYF